MKKSQVMAYVGTGLAVYRVAVLIANIDQFAINLRRVLAQPSLRNIITLLRT